MSILKDLNELLKAEVITKEAAVRIQAYYENRPGSSTNWLFIVFGILGAMLVGLGIILILAHNWDELPRWSKTLLAFLPLVVGQLLCGYVLVNKRKSTTWKEGTTTFLFFAIGASLALVSQIYNIPGNLSSFILSWMLLSLPLVYLMNSSIVSLFYLLGITYYASEVSYWTYPSSICFSYWGLLLLIAPHYYFLCKYKPKSNFTLLHHWFLPLSVVVVLGMFANEMTELILVAYFSLFGLLYLIGSLPFLTFLTSLRNGYKTIGTLGSLGLLLILSFDSFWQELREEGLPLSELATAPEFIVSILLSFLALVFLYLVIKKKSVDEVIPIGFIFIFFILSFVIGLTSPLSTLLINLYLLVIGILTIRAGARQNHLGLLNFGLLIITALTFCRFFDTDLSFIIRGILFVALGAGFFLANYWMLLKRKAK